MYDLVSKYSEFVLILIKTRGVTGSLGNPGIEENPIGTSIHSFFISENPCQKLHQENLRNRTSTPFQPVEANCR